MLPQSEICKVNLPRAAAEIPETFVYGEVGRLNDHMLNVMRATARTLEFHVHEESDEMFYVIAGAMRLETDAGCVDLGPGDLAIIPRGLRHRPIVAEAVTILLVEKAGTLNPGNTGGAYNN